MKPLLVPEVAEEGEAEAVAVAVAVAVVVPVAIAVPEVPEIIAVQAKLKVILMQIL